MNSYTRQKNCVITIWATTVGRPYDKHWYSERTWYINISDIQSANIWPTIILPNILFTHIYIYITRYTERVRKVDIIEVTYLGLQLGGSSGPSDKPEGRIVVTDGSEARQITHNLLHFLRDKAIIPLMTRAITTSSLIIMVGLL